ncbi:MAG: hypothetical protein GY867_01425, partial [bacterium]|nr:hypothetical protein [bacterium]
MIRGLGVLSKVCVSCIVAAVICSGSISCQEASDQQARPLKTDLMSQGRELTSWFLERELDSLSLCIVDKSFTLDKLTAFREKVSATLGRETELLRESVSVGGPEQNYFGYKRYSRFSKTDRPVLVMFGFGEERDIHTFSVESLAPEAPTDFLDYQTKTKLRLPFEGAWYAASGGKTAVHNSSHVGSRD